MAKKISHTVDGIYSAYFTGVAGNSFGMFVFKDGIISGADAGGGKYDGDFKIAEDGNSLAGVVKFYLPVGNQSITGVAATSEPILFEVPIKLPTDLVESDVHTIQTPAGPINAKFEKLRGF